MTLLDRLERRFGQFAISGFIRYVVVFNAAFYLLSMLDRGYLNFLYLDSALVMQGQVWRLFTWIFIPPGVGPIWIFCYLSFTWWAGDCLEATWGSFRLNLYYFLGMFGCTVAAFLFGGVFGGGLLNLSLLFGLATLAPNLEILFFFIFPMKLRWVAFLSFLPLSASFILGNFGTQMAIVVCLLNYLLFFGPTFFRNLRDKQRVVTRRAQFESAKDNTPYLHKCETCGKTELTDPDAEFRVASDDKEYCIAHLPKAISGASLKQPR